jgi:hypothetical protein
MRGRCCGLCGSSGAGSAAATISAGGIDGNVAIGEPKGDGRKEHSGGYGFEDTASLAPSPPPHASATFDGDENDIFATADRKAQERMHQQPPRLQHEHEQLPLQHAAARC